MWVRERIYLHPEEAETNEGIRAFCKWLLDLLRNFIVVAALKFFAEKSNNTGLKVVATIAYVALLMYCLSYLQAKYINLQPSKNRSVNVALFWVLNLTVLGTLWFALSYSVQIVVSEISALQK
jgi:hypothetical protein